MKDEMKRGEAKPVALRRGGVAVALFLAMVAPTTVEAGTITFARVCANVFTVQRFDVLLLYCPGQSVPWLTVTGCPRARVSRLGSEVTITCGRAPNQP